MERFAIKRLKDLAVVRRGYSFRSRLEPVAFGNAAVVQVRDIQSDGVLRVPELVRIQFESAKSSNWLLPGDVVFGSRGGSLSATLVPQGIDNVIAASSVLVIRPKSIEISSEYLVWFLNSPSLGQRQLMASQEGSNIQMLKPQGLADVKVNVPPLEIQRKIGALSTLQRQENELTQRLQAKKTQYTNAVLMKCMNGELT